MRTSADAPEIAVTGYACRLPGARDAAAFWDVLAGGRCTISTVRPDRFEGGLFHDPDPAQRGKTYTLAAGQIEDIWGFDPGFFGLSAREAGQMDPQQRLILQVAWEAVEHAGLRPSDLSGERAGVFVGASASDYSNQFFMDLARIDAQFMTGNTLSIISNRISYLLNLKGPSFTVDTACSSSFYALHEAVAALRRGEIDTAIVGGVNLLVSPAPFVGFSRASMLSRTGLCRAFDAGADGYVRSEGALAVVLRRLDAARANGDRVRSILVGAGINSDGRTVGMALPSAERQADLLRRMRSDLALDPDDLAFVEAHGTGTPVGDPLEARAIGAALGSARREPLPIGSAKSNFGHLEPASGLVGFLKAQMALERGVYPATLHVETPNPNIPFEALNLAVARAPVALPLRERPWFAGINSFGFGGANAHVILRQPVAGELAEDRPAPAPRALVLSAASAESLVRQAALWRGRIAAADAEETARLVSAAAWTREPMTHRLVALGTGREALLAALDDHVEGRKSPAVLTGRSTRAGGRTAFLFSGNGSQWAGMGRHLLATDATFARRFHEIAELFAKLGDGDIAALLAAEDLESRLGSARVAQPVLFAVQMALVAALEAEGLRPDAVAGHSAGEVTAAAVAGIIGLREAVRLVHTRSLALDTLRGTGGMAAVSAGAADVARALSEAGIAGVAVAGSNSPRSSTISGDGAQITAFLAWARRNRRIAGVVLDVEIPYHSPAVEPLRRRLIDDLKGLAPQESPILYASSTTGQVANGKSLDSDYWWHNARDMVRFDDAVTALAEAGCQCFVEISPRPVLGTYVKDTLRAVGHAGTYTRTMDQGAGATLSAAQMVAQAHAEGARLDTARFFGPKAAMPADLPSYPWANAPHRAEPTRDAANNWGGAAWHPLLGRSVMADQTSWVADINARSQPWLADHAVDGSVVLPAAALAEIALAAGRAFLRRDAVELSDFEILRPLVLEPQGGADLRTTADVLTGVVRIEARPRLAEADFALHAIGTLRAAPPAAGPEVAAVTGGEEIAGAALYPALAAQGLAYGPAFRRLGTVRVEGVSATAGLLPGEADPRFALDPAALDSAFHALFPILARHAGGAAPGTVFLPVRIGTLRLLAPGAVPAEARVTVRRRTARGISADLVLLDAAGAMVATLEGLRLQAARLRGRSAGETPGWAPRLVPLRAPDAPVTAPRGWTLPAGRLRALGVAAAEEAEPDPGALLVDAACRRIAWDACRGLADAEGRIDGPAAAPLALPLLARLLAALEEDGLFTAEGPAAGRLAATCPYPGIAVLAASLARDVPGRAPELLDLVQVETALPEVLRGGLRAEPQGVAGVDLSAGARAGWAALARAGHDLAAGWPQGDRLNLLLLGNVPPAVAAALAAEAAVDEITVSAPEDRLAELLRRTLPADPKLRVEAFGAALAPFRHDAILAWNTLGGLGEAERSRLAESLALGGLLVAAEPAQSLFDDLRHGLSAAWWADPARRRAQDWPSLLQPAFRDVSVTPLASGAVEAVVIAARPRQHAVRAGRPAAGEGAARAALLVLADRRRASLHLAELVEASLVAAGIAVRLCTPEEALADEGAASDIVHIAHLTDPGDPPVAAAGRRIEGLRAMMARPAPPERMFVVTRGGRPAAAGRSGARLSGEAAVQGAVRVLANEYPKTRFRLLDFAPGMPAETLAENLCAELVSGSTEGEVVHDGKGMSAVRIEPVPLPRAAGAGDGLRLEIGQHSVLDSLAWVPMQRRAPGPGEVEIEVRATGLNFRDLMWAQGLLPDEALEDGFAGATLGMECAGRVLRAGAGSGFAKGEEVIAFAPACFATHVTVAAEAVARLPAGTSLETAAAVPTVFVTAQYALGTLAALGAGETLLVHGGAGGVGLAALQIARRRGARVFATAGSPAKRRLLEHLGAERVFDSRSLAFADEVRRATGGTGVDVVLNSLAGEAMERSLACLRPFGRFVELGKRDFYANTRLGLRPFRRNLSYFGVDADQLLRERPDLAARLLAEVAAGFAAGDYAPPPAQVFEGSEVVDAFRLMQQSRHVGKVIVRPPVLRPAPRREAKAGPPVREAWLVTGGLGGFGLATARWLGAAGASVLWLASRSGRPRPGDEAALAALRASGVRVEARAADVADRDALRALLDEIGADEVPLRGVVHAAMVLDDARAAELDAARIAAVLAPKLAGAEHLDALTRPFELDHFVLYSSVTTLFGNPGQLPYVAANTALESIAARRREAGLCALAIAWGPIADEGYLARETRTRELLGRRLGGRLLTADEALGALGELLAAGPALPAIAVAPMRWRLLAGDLALLRQPLFQRIDLGEAGAAGESIEDLLTLIEGLSDEAAARKVTEILRGETARILRQPVADIDPLQPLTDLGFDSLMAMDLKLAAEERFGVTIPLLSVGDGMTLAQLAARMVRQIRGERETATGDAEGDRIAAQHLGAAAGNVDEELVRRVTDRAEQLRQEVR